MYSTPPSEPFISMESLENRRGAIIPSRWQGGLDSSLARPRGPCIVGRLGAIDRDDVGGRNLAA